MRTDASATDIRRAALVGGVALLLLGVLGGFANFAVLERLVVEGSAPETAAQLSDSEALFRFAVLSLLLVAALDVVVAWALYRVFAPVSDGLSLLAAWFRLAYAAILVVATADLVRLLRLLGDDSEAFSAQALQGVEAFRDLWVVGLALFGVHLILVGYLVYRATYAPTWLGVLLVIAGAGYAIDGVGEVLLENYGVGVAAFTFIGEVVLIVWLLLRARRLTVPA